jgi:hypothetical protein
VAGGLSQTDGAAEEGRRIRASFPPRNDGQRRGVLRYVRETPFAHGTWTHLKWLYKQAEGTVEAEILGALIGRLDAEGFRNVAGRARPVVVGSLLLATGLSVGASAPAIALHGTRGALISAGYGRGVRCIDVSNPRSPAQVALINPSPVSLVAFDAGRVYALGVGRPSWWRRDRQSAELYVMEEAAGKVRQLGSVRLGELGRARALVVRDGRAYLAAGSWTGTLRVADLRNPARPRLVAELDLPPEFGQAYLLTVLDRFLYVPAPWRKQSLVVDVSDPARPVVRGPVDVDLSGMVVQQGALAYQIRAAADPRRLRAWT